MRRLLMLTVSALPLISMADTLTINEIEYSAPIALRGFAALGDTTGICEGAQALNLAVNDRQIAYSKAKPQVGEQSLVIMAADFENRGYMEATITVDSITDYALYIDGKKTEAGSKQKLHPGTHRATIKHVAKAGIPLPDPVITIATPQSVELGQATDHRRMITLADVMYGKRVYSTQISPSGAYVIVTYRDTQDGGKSAYTHRLYDVAKERFTAELPSYAQWMHKSDRYCYQASDYANGRHIVAVDPATGARSVIASHLPEGDYRMSPTDDYLVYSLMREGAKEDPQIYRVIEPEDRQPGWRDRTYPAIYRFDTQALQPIALGKNDLNVADISADGTHLLINTPTRRLTARPTTLFALISLDINTLEADTIVAADGFISDARYSRDGRKVYVTGSPESFDRVGCTLPDGVIPSAYDYQLFEVDIESKAVRSLTRELDPSVNAFAEAPDGTLYVTTTDRDMYRIYSINPRTGETKAVDTPINVVNGMDIAASAPVMVYYGQTDSTPDAVYVRNTKSGKETLVDMPSEARLADVRIGECVDWTYTNAKGETVYARYYLPDNFDPTKRYPLVVDYYGGCTPSTRTFESRYPMHVYASLGYVCLVIQPSGAAGFGQEWSSRHVSTAGAGVAEDIISGVETFCKEMDFVNPDKVGCIGASYGGFMTQYLQTLTDIFAAAISHAGISDHTSYWGEGYWGYSYSEVSMGDDLPWTNPDLYVKQSPLYNAHKIHTPILFLHGDADTNVPVGESIQMFTALKRLGAETALVQVADQNHHILDDSKRKKWQDTIFAWFAKYLQDDPTWWEALYPSQD